MYVPGNDRRLMIDECGMEINGSNKSIDFGLNPKNNIKSRCQGAHSTNWCLTLDVHLKHYRDKMERNNKTEVEGKSMQARAGNSL